MSLAAPPAAAAKKPEKKPSASARPTPNDRPKTKGTGKKKGPGSAGKNGAGKGFAGAGVNKPAATEALPQVIERARVEQRIDGGPTFVTTIGGAGLFLHVDFGVSSRHDPDGRPGMAELAARTWFLASAPLWSKVEARGGTAALSLGGDRMGVAITLPRGEEGFAGWLLPRLFDHTAPRPETIAAAARALADAEDPVRDALIENLYQGARALAHRTDAAKLASVDGAEMATFLRARFAPERATIGVVAPEGASVCGTACAAGFASLAGRAAPAIPMPTPPEQTLQRTVHLDLGGAPAVTYGFLYGVDPRREAALRIASVALCDARTGRLAAKLRATGATCKTHLEPRDGPGIFTLRVEGAEEAALGKTIARIDEELIAMSKSPLPKADFVRARERALVTLLEDTASPAQIAADLAAGRPDPAAFVAAAGAMDAAALAEELGRGLDPLRRTVVVERRGTERLWKTPRPPGTKKPDGKGEPKPDARGDAKKPDTKGDAKKPDAKKPAGKAPAKRRP